jgi:hypothetical protein
VLALVDAAAASTAFEIAMLFCFGISWPFAVAKTYRSKNVGGKSAVFLWFVICGYAAGILFKVFGRLDWVVGLYALNGVMVALDLTLYYRYRGTGAAAGRGGPLHGDREEGRVPS